MSPEASAAPMNCIRMNIGAEDGLMPAKLSENMRAVVTAGLAKLVDDVNQYAPAIHAPTAARTSSGVAAIERTVRASACHDRPDPAGCAVQNGSGPQWLP